MNMCFINNVVERDTVDLTLGAWAMDLRKGFRTIHAGELLFTKKNSRHVGIMFYSLKETIHFANDGYLVNLF